MERTQCHWMHPTIAKLYIERAAYERAGRPRAVITAAVYEAELALVSRLRDQLDKGASIEAALSSILGPR